MAAPEATGREAEEAPTPGALPRTRLDRSQPPTALQGGAMGARLRQRLTRWQEITGDSWVLKTLDRGHSIEFLSTPPPLPPSLGPRGDTTTLLAEVQMMLAKGAIIEVPSNSRGQGCYSRYFTVPKKDNAGDRPILDLRLVNLNVKPLPFRMVTVQSIIPLVRRGEWLTSLDLKDAYFHVPILKAHQQFLRFMVADKHYQFQVLPFGLKSAPRTFTKCLAPVAAHLRKQGIEVFPYLDDWMVKAQSEAEARSATDTCLQTLEDLGLLINYTKSKLSPTRCLTFLGTDFDTVAAMVRPAQPRVEAMTALAARLRTRPASSARLIASMLGMMSSAIFIIENCRLRMRPLQECLATQWSQSSDKWSKKLILSNRAKQSLLWWTQPSNLLKGVPFLYPEHQHTVTTDASLEGWGAHLEGHQTQGLWESEDRKRHINFLELKAVVLALKAFLPLISGTSVRVLTDNTTCMFYIRKQGGTRSKRLSHLAQELWEWAITNGIRLTAQHLAGVHNTQADHLSRLHVESHEWELQDETLVKLFRKWGTPDIDLFATSANKKCNRFASRWQEQGSVGDALVVPWNYSLLYAFPPTPLLHRVLLKFRSQNTQMILVAPAWPRQTWFPEIMRLATSEGIPLGSSNSLLSRDGGKVLHHDPRALHLTAWLLRS